VGKYDWNLANDVHVACLCILFSTYLSCVARVLPRKTTIEVIVSLLFYILLSVLCASEYQWLIMTMP